MKKEEELRRLMYLETSLIEVVTVFGKTFWPFEATWNLGRVS
jgi:hypothetical protein